MANEVGPDVTSVAGSLTHDECKAMLTDALIALRAYNRLFGPIQQPEFNRLRKVIGATPIGGTELPH